MQEQLSRMRRSDDVQDERHVTGYYPNAWLNFVFRSNKSISNGNIAWPLCAAHQPR